MVFQKSLKTPVDPVKWIPAKSAESKTVSVIIAEFPYTTLITPSGKPAFLKISMIILAEKTWVAAGFHTTTLPIIATLEGRLAAIAVKLNGVMAYTKPSSGRCSTLFQIPLEEIGCCL